ncbi:TadE-like protein [Gemmobacter aquatilis]|uniref:TadE-like protein n=1 Tax=Gemmobacter aquatilis TaxID=933059 RepID=A0A1H8J698_9RHOB|nr:TadE family protein [Gemmobacter aquatilis]SEN76473.1 TadE-like protein [Gemmobacter aquatilis]
MTTGLRAHFATCQRWFRREDGTATIEFVLMIPILMTVFMACFEAGLMTLRQTMLERALDIAMRDLRLGHLGLAPTHDDLKDAICANSSILTECDNTLLVSLDRVSQDDWVLPAVEVVCRDRASDIEPVTTLDTAPGARSVIMLVRVCLRADAIFPSTGIAANIDQDGEGGYRLVAASAFMNEP